MFPSVAMGLGSRGQYQWPFSTRGLGTGLLAPFAESGIVVTVTNRERTISVEGRLDTIGVRLPVDVLEILNSQEPSAICVDAPGLIRLYYDDSDVRVLLSTPDIPVEEHLPIPEIRAQVDTEDVG